MKTSGAAVIDVTEKIKVMTMMSYAIIGNIMTGKSHNLEVIIDIERWSADIGGNP